MMTIATSQTPIAWTHRSLLLALIFVMVAYTRFLEWSQEDNSAKAAVCACVEFFISRKSDISIINAMHNS